MKKSKLALLHSAIALLLCVSMLAGTTFAWFTDAVNTGINTIAAGNLDVELYHSNAAVTDERVQPDTELFKDLRGDPILWEPGVVSFENLRVANEGDLALAYQLSLATANENFVVDPSGTQYGLSQILKVGVVEGGITATDRDGVVASVADADWTTLESVLRGGSLLPEGAGESEKVWGIVIWWEPGENDNFWNLNNGKQLNEGEVLKIDLGVKVIATQNPSEFDNFGNDYDENAKAEFFPGFQGGSAGAVVTADDQGVTVAEVTMAGGDVSAVIPAGVLVADSTKPLEMSVTLKENSEANIQLNENEEMRPLDVHIEGVAQGNTVPMLITLKHYLSTGINTGALRLYHVENGVTVAMTQVSAPANHNEFSYDPATGDVTLALASFSEVAVAVDANNPWDGETINTLWYNASATELTIYNADQLAGFAAIVDGKAEGIAQDSFSGKTVKLANNITLSGKLFDPIGWGYVNTQWNSGGVEGKVFQGTFDGNGKIIFDLYQNGWDLEAANGTDYTYTNCGFGLFAAASGATFQNLTISGAYVRVECVEAGVLVGLSQNNCMYNNIKILNSKIANYQRPAGGLIGEVSGEGTTTITNVTIGSDVVVGSLWGDFDAPVGGVIGARWDDANANPQIVMTDVEVGARLDVYNDITSAYQWHAYRRAGMLIGNTELTDPNNAHKAYAPFLHCDKVRVYYGDWVNYHYCQFTNQDNAWANNYPWVRVEAGENCSAYSNPRYGQPVVGGVTVSTDDHTCTDEHHMVRQFSQLYGGGQGVYGQDKHDGVTYPANAYSITYVNDGKTLDIIYVTDNTKAYSVGSDQAEKLVAEWAEENMKEDYNGYVFGGWMTAASKKLTEIPQGNTQNIVLYPYFTSPYTASFVDVESNVLAWCFFNEINVDNLSATFAAAKQNCPNPGDDYELLYWVVRGTDTNGNAVNVQLADNNTNWESFKGYKDVTITPHYRYMGADLIEVYDELTGEIDHYQVAGYTGGIGSEIVEIPGYVNGKPVTEINANAFSSYDDLHSVRIPGTIATMEYQSFTADNPNKWGDQRDTVTLYYEGDPAVWNAAMEKYNNEDYSGMLKQSWDNMMGESSCVFFLDANGKVDLSKGYWELAEVRDPDSFFGLGTMFVWQYHNHTYGSNSGCGNEHNNKTDYIADCKCDLGTHARPDKKYWE